MRLTYQTGIATFIQFVTLSLLNIATGTNSVVTTCRHDGGNCVGNLFVSVVFYLLTVAWFASVWLLGFLAQQRRNRRLAQLLICAEGLIALIAFFNAKHHTDILSLFTSLVDLFLAIWIITLAFRLMRAGDNRVVRRQGRARRRVRS